MTWRNGRVHFKYAAEQSNDARTITASILLFYYDMVVVASSYSL